MRLFCPIVGILRIIVDNIQHQFMVSNTITSQLICHYLPRFAILVNRPPLVILPAVDFHEYLANVESVTEAPMLSL